MNFARRNNSGKERPGKQHILKAILIASIVLFSWGEIFILKSTLSGGNTQHHVGLALFTLILSSVVLAFYLLKKGYTDTASHIIIAIFFIGTSYGAYRWGPNLPAVLLGYAIVVVVSGILQGSKTSLAMTLMSGLIITSLGVLESKRIYIPDLEWKQNLFNPMDGVQYFIMLFLILTVSWLSERENIKALKRATDSEATLKTERDNLEIKVEERTKEIRQVQNEKITQLYTFAELGKVAAGAIHDLANPLTAVSLNIERMKVVDEDTKRKQLIDRALTASQKMRQYLDLVRTQLQTTDTLSFFSLNKEILSTLELIEHRKNGLPITVTFPVQDKNIYGNPTKFNQVIINLLSNSIDAYTEQKRGGTIDITFDQNRNETRITVSDQAGGIPPHIETKLFQPFATSKGKSGTGLGLSTTKHIIEKDFHGTLSYKNTPGKGVSFTITIPSSSRSKLHPAQSPSQEK